VVEALNSSEFRAYGLDETSRIQTLINRVLSETGTSVWQQYDVYHARRAGEDIVSTIAALAPTFG
jgi:hydroxypyruvate isomerase